jgi:RHS repeat-associated protein
MTNVATENEARGLESRSESPAPVKPPVVSLPRGGGAIRGIGEKFAANPVTGTGSMNIPITASSGRGGFGPQLSLAYDSGAGSGPFGLGWRLALPAITRKTDKGLPQYDDAAESDVFTLSGAEDLVPVLAAQGDRWVREDLPPRTVGGVRYHVQRYRPRVEGLFARIERWTNLVDPADVFWRSISRDNITTWYGRTAESRIADPADPRRIFTWLVSTSYDDKGNVISYGYKPEDDERVDNGQASERNRERRANRYLKRILYGNRVPYLPVLDPATDWPALPGADQWHFELVFDYGEHDRAKPLPQDAAAWAARPDPFSSYRSGFEVRTYRLCQRALMFHHFPGQPEIGADCLVRSTDFIYSGDENPADPRNPVYSTIVAVVQRGYQREGDGYRTRSLPPAEFSYSQVAIQSELHELPASSLENLPAGIDGAQYLWVDLDGEGLPGIFSEQGGGWQYKRNLSPVSDAGREDGPARFGLLEEVTARPPLSLAEGAHFLDLAGDGHPDIVQFAGASPGFCKRTDGASWEPFTTFSALPNRDWGDPNVRLVDLDGDGLADVLITEHDALAWHPSLGDDGFGQERRVSAAWDDDRGAAVVFANGEQSVYLADMSGDGLADLVRIRNGEVSYWPNLGYSRFGPKVTMDGAPWFDRSELFDQRRVRLADIDGSGTTDIIYLHAEGVRIYFNQSGNGWGDSVVLPQFPSPGPATSVQVLDLLGNGTACLVWSSPMPGDTRCPLRYLDLMGGRKPHLLVTAKNNLGTETAVEYAPSTKFYLQDKMAGTPWVTRLPFPVHVVERVTTRDKWRGTSFSSTYSYHHGYFDGTEREFRGFGRVEQVDTEDYGTFADANLSSPYVSQDRRLYQPPVKTVTWYHPGAPLAGEHVGHQFQREYFPSWYEKLQPGQQAPETFHERAMPEPDLDAQGLAATEWREALRACQGIPLRQEVYELDADALGQGRQTRIRLFSAISHSCRIRLDQPQAGNRHAVFQVTEDEAVSYHYDLDLRTAPLAPDPRITHTLNLNVDEYGNVLQAVTVGYPRWQALPLDDPLLAGAAEALVAAVQGELHVSYAETRYTDDVTTDPDSYRLCLPCERQTFELTGITPGDAGDGRYFAADQLRVLKLSDRYQAGGTPVEAIPSHQLPEPAKRQKRLVGQTRSLFTSETLDQPLPLGGLNARALPYETYALALTDSLLAAVLADKLTPDVVAVLGSGPASGYLSGQELAQLLGEDTAGQHWRRTGIAGYDAAAPQHFFLPGRYTDPFGHETLLDYDPSDLFVSASTDPLGNRTEVTAFDYRVLAARQVRDSNGNSSEVRFDVVGRPAATALSGKGGEGDDLSELDEAALDPEPATLAAFFVTDDYDAAQAQRLLGRATSRYLYHFGEVIQDGVVSWERHPPCAAAITREEHAAQQPGSPVQAAFEYSDGSGAVLVSKVQAEPAVPGGPLRWVASGKTVLNNKGMPVKQYEPYFSPPEVGHRFEDPPETGVTPVLSYDAAGRQIRADSPDGSFSRVEFSPWHVTSYDANDTVLEPGNAWFARMNASPLAAEQRAAQAAAVHAATPALTLLDSLGRSVVTVAHNRTDGTDEKYLTFRKLDAQGRPLWVQDARGNRVTQYVTPPLPGGVHPFDDAQNLAPQGIVPCYDLTGQPLLLHSMDAGDRWLLNDAAGTPLFTWTSRGFRSRTTYDALRRPVGVFLSAAGDTTPDGGPRDTAAPPGPEALVERRVYGETHPDASANLRGKLYQVYDGAGVAVSTRYDFTGNLLSVSRRFARDYTAVPDWSALAALTGIDEIIAAAEPLLEPVPLTTQTTYDALNRPVTIMTPDGSLFRAAFNEAKLLERVELTVRDAAATPFVTNIDYDAKGQRARIDYGNGTTTSYDYDPLSFRLTGLKTTRPAPPDATASMLFSNPVVVQDLHYTYDPVGNITRIEDAALSTTVQAGNACDLVYDALYRLIAASGREHSGQTAFAFDPDDASLRDYPFAGARVHPNDLRGGLRDYVERYTYDPVGNVMHLAHHAGGNVDQPGAALWHRRYQYALDSNRLLATSLPGDPDDLPDYAEAGGYAATYGYDPAGNITRMMHLPLMRWSYHDHLVASSPQLRNDGTPETTYYVYAADGQRVRKVTETQPGVRKNERLYLDGYEIYREYGGTGVAVERETLQVLDGKQRIAIVETQTTPAGPSVHRYQLGNHLGSAAAELDEAGALISYEEYHPYGTTAFQAGRSAAEVSLKRYRYTGKERDDETGLGYHRARYYVPWLGRWASADPLGISAGINVYLYASANPVAYRDPTGMSIEENVRNELKDAFRQRGIYFAEEVQFYVLDAAGNYKINPSTGKRLEGRADLVWEDRETGKIRFLEGKGTDKSPKTPNQIEYIPEFEKGGGWEIKGTKGGNLGLEAGVRGSAKEGGFSLVHSGNLKDFISAQLARFKAGEGQFRFITVSAKGERSVKFFDTAEELAHFKTQRGVGTPGKIETPPPPPAQAKAPAETAPHSVAPPKPSAGGQRLPAALRIVNGLGVALHVLDIYTAYKELETELKGGDLHPDGYYDMGLGGRIITDFKKLPEGFSSHVISGPPGYGPGLYEKRNGDIYKDGKLQHIIQNGQLVSGGA